MMHTIENDRFRVSALETGAELTSFWDKREQHEYLWQKSEVWMGQSPLLFPVVGKLRNDAYCLHGRQYHLPKHGFARRAEFALERREPQEMTFLLTDSPQTRESYPFAFELRVDYAMREDGFTMRFRVKNPGTETMYFSLGAHPGFRCAMGDRVVMDLEETAGAYRLGKDGLRGMHPIPVFHHSREIVITPEVFAEDALIFDGLRSSGATLVRNNGKSVHVDFGGAPCLGLWAKPGAEYVCIEPWYGIDDRRDTNVDFSRKERICALAAGTEFIFPVTVAAL